MGDETSNPFEEAKASESTETEGKKEETATSGVETVYETEPTAFEKQAEVVRKLSVEVTNLAKGRVETDISTSDDYWDKKNELHLAHHKLESLRGQ